MDSNTVNYNAIGITYYFTSIISASQSCNSTQVYPTSDNYLANNGNWPLENIGLVIESADSSTPGIPCMTIDQSSECLGANLGGFYSTSKSCLFKFVKAPVACIYQPTLTITANRFYPSTIPNVNNIHAPLCN